MKIGNKYEQLERLSNLLEKGYVTMEEFNIEKKKILGTDKSRIHTFELSENKEQAGKSKTADKISDNVSRLHQQEMDDILDLVNNFGVRITNKLQTELEPYLHDEKNMNSSDKYLKYAYWFLFIVFLLYISYFSFIKSYA